MLNHEIRFDNVNVFSSFWRSPCRYPLSVRRARRACQELGARLRICEQAQGASTGGLKSGDVSHGQKPSGRAQASGTCMPTASTCMPNRIVFLCMIAAVSCCCLLVCTRMPNEHEVRAVRLGAPATATAEWPQRGSQGTSPRQRHQCWIPRSKHISQGGLTIISTTYVSEVHMKQTNSYMFQTHHNY